MLARTRRRGRRRGCGWVHNRQAAGRPSEGEEWAGLRTLRHSLAVGLAAQTAFLTFAAESAAIAGATSSTAAVKTAATVWATFWAGFCAGGRRDQRGTR